MTKKKKTDAQRRREQRQQKWERENERVRNLLRKGPHYKKLLRMRGCELPFYDLLDSYAEQFRQVAENAVVRHQTLLGVHEVIGDFREWDSLGYGKLSQLMFDIGSDAPDYGARVAGANLRGSMSAFRDGNGELRTVILIRKDIETSSQHSEIRYAFKLASLLHEVGHVADFERQINFDVGNLKIDVVEAEVFAHIHALNAMAEGNYFHSYHMLRDALEAARGNAGYLGQVATAVIERLPVHTLIEWQRFIDEPATPDEARLLGQRSIDAIARS